MALSNQSYVSVFKINGKPILPPVIDENRRIELNQDRALAIEIERRLKLKRTHHTIADESVMGNAVTNNNFDDTLNNDGLEWNASNCDTSAAVDSLLDDNAQTHHDTTILSHTGEDSEHCVHGSSSDESHVSDNPDHTKSTSKAAPLTLSIDSNFGSITPKNPSPSFSLHSSPSVDALNESRNLSLYFTPSSGRESFSPIAMHKAEFTPRLIRSNSYTLDKPSPMLIKHMKSSVIIQPTVNDDASHKSPMMLRRFQNNQTNTSTCLPRKAKLNENVNGKSRSNAAKTSIGGAKSMSTLNASASPKFESLANGSIKSNSAKSTKAPNKCQPSNPVSVFKNSESLLRSIYGQKTTVKVQHSSKKNKTAKTITSESLNQNSGESSHTHINNSISSNHSNGNNKLNTQNYNQMLALFEQQHAELLKRQQEEQKRMQEEFLRQQEELLQKIQILIGNKSSVECTPNGSTDESTTKKSNEKMLIDEVNNALPVIVDSNGNRVNRFTSETGKCIRRLQYDEHKSNLNSNNIDNGQLSPMKLSTDGSEQFDMYAVEEVRAASIIVAHVKGYLIRRLFKTKKVMDLRKMHYDTLELLLDISEEDNKNESKSDVEFKYNLIQQLASIGIELHKIFFALPMDERMDIISKDRIIKERLQISLNRTKSVDNSKTNPKHHAKNNNNNLNLKKSMKR